MKQSELLFKIEELLERKTSNKEPTPMTWLVDEIVKQHPRIGGEDLDFFWLCAYEHVRDSVRDVFRNMGRPGLDANAQTRFEGYGFQHLQTRYPVERAGEVLAMPVELMTDDELDAKADYYAKMGEGVIAHSNEIRQYKRLRRQSIAAA